MTVSDAELSRVVSHALRHEPWVYELEVDDEGWVSVDQLLAALQEKGGPWGSVDRTSLGRMQASATKHRHEFDGERVRALYGHSLPTPVRKRPSIPPDRLFHGTAPETLTAIRREGLLPMQRQFVHLSVDRETALMVGRRKSASPAIVMVDAFAAHSAGTVFYQGNELVWLAGRVPAESLQIVQ